MNDGIRYNRTRFVAISSFEKIAPGRYTACRAGHTNYWIEGGRALGGTSKDWMVGLAGSSDFIRCTSVKDALRLIEQGF